MLKAVINRYRIKGMLNDAAKFYQSHSFWMAEKKYKEILGIDSDNFDAHLWIGSLYSETDKYLDAQVHFAKAIELNSESFEPHFNYGMMQEKLGRHEEALKEFELALKKVGDNEKGKVDVLFNIGALKFQMGEYGQAMDYANKALGIYPNHPNAEKLKMGAYQKVRNENY